MKSLAEAEAEEVWVITWVVDCIWIVKGSFFFLIFGCTGPLFLRAGFLYLQWEGATLLWCKNFSLLWLLLLRNMGSRRMGFSSCATWAELPCGMWDFPGPRVKPLSPALAGGFLTKGPPGKSQKALLFMLWTFPEGYSQLVNTRSRRHSSDLRKLF